MKLEILIARAKFYEKTQKAIAKKLAISETKFSDWKKGKTKPTPFEIFQIAELARVEPEKAFYEVMTEVDKDNADYWCARRELNPRPSASETYRAQLSVTINYIVNLINRPLRHIEHSQGERNASYFLYHHAQANL